LCVQKTLNIHLRRHFLQTRPFCFYCYVHSPSLFFCECLSCMFVLYAVCAKSVFAYVCVRVISNQKQHDCLFHVSLTEKSYVFYPPSRSPTKNPHNTHTRTRSAADSRRWKKQLLIPQQQETRLIIFYKTSSLLRILYRYIYHRYYSYSFFYLSTIFFLPSAIIFWFSNYPCIPSKRVYIHSFIIIILLLLFYSILWNASSIPSFSMNPHPLNKEERIPLFIFAPYFSSLLITNKQTTTRTPPPPPSCFCYNSVFFFKQIILLWNFIYT